MRITFGCYFALNPMKFVDKGISRDKAHVARLKFLYVDLDVYKSDWSEYTQDQILMQLEADYFDTKIPTPSYVVNSGRGMYLLWRIDEHVNAQPRWEKVQRYLNSQLLEFGADRAVVTDTARVLRIVGSTNSKSKTEVSMMACYDKKYTLYEIMQEYMQDDISSYNYTRTNKKKKAYKGNSKVIFIDTPYSLYHARISDLEHLLIKYRDKENGMRENILFLYRYFSLCVTEDKAASLKATVELNSRLNYPLDEKEVTKATASAEKYFDNDKTLKISNDKLIEFLNITNEEMKDLRSIISKQEKANRKALRDRKRYLLKLAESGKNTKEYNIKVCLKKMYELLDEGLKQPEISAKLNISKATFYNYKKMLREYTYEELENCVMNSGDSMVCNKSLKKSALVLKEDEVLMPVPAYRGNIEDFIYNYLGVSGEYWDDSSGGVDVTSLELFKNTS